MWAHEEGGQSEQKAIEGAEIRGALSGAIADQELMLEQQRLRSDTADAIRAEEFREGDEQVDRQEEQIAHASNLITPVIARKIARQGMFEIKKNGRGEQSYVEFECEAEGVPQARALFLGAVLPFLDHQAYLANCPLYVAAVRIEDPTNLRTSMDYVSPYREVVINPHVKTLHTELSPVYALYRDAKNSHSDFYTFLCYHKILDGLLGSIRAALRARAAKKKLLLSQRRDLVSVSEHISPAFQSWVGKPIKTFFDDVMTPQFRNTIAHFITKDGAVLNLSNPQQMDRYASILYISELCVRTVLETHEVWLSELAA